jgi:hypothetical protein
MSTSKTQRSFAAGEIAPALYGRSDLVAFGTGLAGCRNFFVLRHGGVANRSGSKYLATVKDSSSRTYLAKFVFNTAQTYVIEVGHLYFRFFAQGAIIGAPYELATPYVAADLSTLRFVQSGNVVTITHENYQPRELRRVTDTNWTLTTITTAPSIAAPTGLGVVAGGGSAYTYQYKVTAVQADTYEESLPAAAVSAIGDHPSVARPNVLSWAAVVGAVEYNVYGDRGDGNGFGFIGVTANTSFSDVGYLPDLSYTPPTARSLFTTATNYPRVAGYYQQRELFASTVTDPEKIWASTVGAFKNFTISSPIQDDDAVTWVNAGLQVNEIRHLIEMDRLFVFTSGAVWFPRGDDTGTLTPTAIWPKKLSPYGAATVPPVIAGTAILYVQDRAQRVRALDTGDGANEDVSLFVPHFFERYTLERMDYAENPYSILWGVRSDGTLLSLTFMPEHHVLGWGRHDTDGVYEDVCVVPEGNEDAVYVIVKRIIGGATKRYVERFASRRFTNIKTDALFLDCFLTYDGRNTSAESMTFSTSAGWTVNDEITVTRSVGGFVAGDVGNAIVLLDASGNELVRVVITSYTSGTVVKGYPSLTVPTASRAVPTTSWARAVDELANLNHLEQKTASILADGNVLPQATVNAGAITLGGPYMVIHVGLPITADLETLDLDLAEAELRDKKKKLSSVSLLVQDSRGIFAGPDADHLYEYKPRLTNYSAPPALLTELIEIPITSSWAVAGRILVRQTDPLPLTVLTAIPNGDVGG